MNDSKKTVIIECKNCQKKFERIRWINKNSHQKFCSQECFIKYRKKNMVGRKANWNKFNQKESTKKYKREWHEKKWFNHINLLINAKCEICNNNKNLLIHHKDGCNGRSNPKLNNNLENLMILCRRCHPKIHNRYWLKMKEKVM